jgi:hypothetical protein
MKAWVLPDIDVSYLDEIILNKEGLVQPLPYSVYQDLDLTHLQVWCNKKGVYTLPTNELIAWIKNRIGGRKAIEICAGTGGIARALGIIATDSYIQTMPEMVAYYKAIGTQPIDPPSDVYQFEANEAVDTLKPKVVVGCYATQKFQEGDQNEPKVGSSVYGVDEMLMLPKIETYICVGNDHSHHDKRIIKLLPHETHRFPWIVTRTMKQEENFIKVWDNQGQ